MSTPQDTPDPGQHHGDGHSWNAPGAPGGSTSPYGRSSGSGQYDHPSGSASGYTYPGGGAMPQQTEKGPAPKEVMRAYYLILAAGALYLLNAVGSVLLIDTSDLPGAGGGAATIGYVVGLTIAAIGTAVYVSLAVFIRKGHNWARITATVLAALNVVFSLIGLLVTPLLSAQATEMGQAVVETPFLAQLISVVVMLLGVTGVVLTYLKPARPYFAPRQIGY